MKDPKHTLGFWLNSRQGFYDPATINRLQGKQKAFNAYVEQCEKAYQASVLKSMNADASRLRTLNEEMREFLRLELWPMIMRSANGDLRKAKELIRQEPYSKLVEEYDLKDDINKQYKKCSRVQ